MSSDSELLYNTANILGDAPTAGAACYETLKLVRSEMDLEVACFWQADYETLVLQCAYFDSSNEEEFSAFKSLCFDTRLGIGEGAPGKVWLSRTPIVIPDIGEQGDFLRLIVASSCRLRSYCAVPLIAGDVVMGVLEVFSTNDLPKPERLNDFQEVGKALGQFLNKQRSLVTMKDRLEAVHTEAILTIDAESKILFVNPAACKLFGYEKTELIGESLTVLIPPELRDRHLAGFSRYMHTGKRSLNWDGIRLPAMHKNGSQVPVEISFGEVLVGERRLFSGYVRVLSK